MAIDLTKITCSQFCDIHGVSDTDRMVIEKRHSTEQMSYVKWHEKLVIEYGIGEPRQFAVEASKKPVKP